MGLLGGLFGGKTPQVKMPTYDAEGLGLTQMKKDMAGSVNQYRSDAKYWTGKTRSMFDMLMSNQGMGSVEQGVYNQAEGSFAQALSNAKLNAMNIAGNQIGGSMSSLAGKGLSTGGAYAANIKAGVLAAQQNSLNELSTNQMMKLLDLRNSLTNQSYEKLANAASFVTSQQAQSDSLAGANLGTLLGDNSARMKMEFDVNAYNAQLKAASQASKLGAISGIAGGLLNIGGSFAGKGFGG